MGLLKDSKIRSAKPKEKDYKLSNGDGLYLLVQTSGRRAWRYNYRYMGKQKTITYGSYPKLTLAEANKQHRQATSLLASQIDPALHKKQQKFKSNDGSFLKLSEEWLAKKESEVAAVTLKKNQQLLNNDILPFLASRPIKDIETYEISGVIQRILDRGANGTAGKAVQALNQIFRYARQTGQLKYNPADDLTGLLPRSNKKHMAAIIDPAKFGKLLVDIDAYQGTNITRTAIALAPLLFQRPSELCSMEWQELDFENDTWIIPIEKKKERSMSKEDHIVPLCSQVKELLLDLKPQTGHKKYVFPNQRNPERHLRVESLNKALRIMGYDTKAEHTAHGFRASARTMLDEQLQIRIDWIEHQLAHKVKDPLGNAYNRTKHLPQRIEMMQRWGDYLDDLKRQTIAGNVVTGNFQKIS